MTPSPLLSDGTHQTSPIHGHVDAQREVEVVGGFVRIAGQSFTQDDFFRVNRVVEDPVKAKALRPG